jgi:hypothetical protein
MLDIVGLKNIRVLKTYAWEIIHIYAGFSSNGTIPEDKPE